MSAQSKPVPQIEFPASTLPVNKHLLENTSTAYRCMLYLVDEYSVDLVSIEIGPRNPIIWIQPPPNNLLGLRPACRVIQSRGQQKQTIMASLVNGCQVQWKLNQ